MCSKFLGFLGLFLSFIHHCFPQNSYFQGSINYQVAYQAQKMGYDTKALEALHGNQQILHIQKKKWAAYYNGLSPNACMYQAHENKKYQLYPYKKIAVLYDGLVFPLKVKKTYLSSETMDILGIPCQAFVIETEKEKIYYYHNPQYKVDPQLFEASAIDPLNFMWQKSQGALPLAQIIMKENYSVVCIATKLLPYQPTFALFQIPPDYEIIPSAQGMNEQDLTLLQAYANRRIKYPKSAAKAGIEGIVIVELLVDEKNRSRKIDIIQGIHPDCDYQVFKIVRSFPHWQAGIREGQAAKIIYAVPIYFSLD